MTFFRPAACFVKSCLNMQMLHFQIKYSQIYKKKKKNEMMMSHKGVTVL